MGRLKKIDRGMHVQFYVPTSVYQKVREQLYSEIEGRVPFGSMSALGTALFIAWLKERGVEV